MPVPYGSTLHIPVTNLRLLAAKQEPYKKAYLLTKNIEEFSGKSSEERTSRYKKIRQKGLGHKESFVRRLMLGHKESFVRRLNRTRQKNKRGASKVESNDSPQIPDRRETSDIPGLPSGEHSQYS